MDEQECSSASLYPNILGSGLPPSLPLNAYGELDIKKEVEVKAEPPSSDTEGEATAAILASMSKHPVVVQNSKWTGSGLVDFAVAGSSSSSVDTTPSIPVFTCAQCRKEFHRIQELRFHVRTHKFLLCVKCGKHFDSLAELVAHSNAFPRAHGGDHACPDCGLGFEGREELEKHSYLHQLSFSITCQGLEAKIYDFFNFMKIVLKTPYEDLNLIHDGEEAAEATSADERPSTSESPVPRKAIKMCLLCRDVCIGNEAYTNHINNQHSSHDYVEPITCKVCGSTFITLTARKAHLNLFHKLDEDYEPLPYHQHKCTECERSFGNVHALRGHINKTHAEGCAQCRQCPDKFKSKAELDAHLLEKHRVEVPKKNRVHPMTHGGKRNFNCGVCQQRFQTMLRCQEHIRKTHVVEKCYQCDLCPKSFKSLSGLNTHLRFHNNVRPYDCPGCGKGFHTRQNMLVHRDKHCKVRLEDDISVTEHDGT